MNNDKLDELKKLNEKFYELYGRLHENEELLGDAAQLKLFRQNLFEQYKAEYNLFKIKYETAEGPALYEAQVRHDILIPRRNCLIFRNRARKLIDGEIKCEQEEFFAKREKKLKDSKAALGLLKAKLDKADGKPSEPATTSAESDKKSPAPATSTPPASAPKATAPMASVVVDLSKLKKITDKDEKK